MRTDTMAKVRQLAGLDAKAPLSEVHDFLDTSIAAKAATAEGAAAGAEDEEAETGEQTVAAEVAATEKEVATANATDAAITAAVQLATADLQATVTSLASTVEAQAATITALQNRVEEVAGEDAAEPVTGKREASDIGKPVRAYRLNPMNQ